jgi:imidazole glycerol-phosphate synthase subunit HisF
MLMPRVIPCLLLRNSGLVKTIVFKAPKYLGDPINTVKIFNDKEVDELIFLDITAAAEKREPPFKLLEQVATEAFMPLGYGGNVRTLEDVRTILGVGVEKVIINTQAIENPGFLTQAAEFAGSSSVVASIDVKRSLWGSYRVWSHVSRKSIDKDPVQFAKEMADRGAGEIMLNSVDRDGTMKGYDLDLVKQVTSAVNIPVVACGGASSVEDLGKVINEAGASAAAAGSMFVFHGPHRAVLISYPSPQALRQAILKKVTE